MKCEGDTSILIQEAMRCWLPNRNSDGEEKKDTEHDLRRALNEELGQSMIQVPVGRRKPDFAAVVV